MSGWNPPEIDFQSLNSPGSRSVSEVLESVNEMIGLVQAGGNWRILDLVVEEGEDGEVGGRLLDIKSFASKLN